MQARGSTRRADLSATEPTSAVIIWPRVRDSKQAALGMVGGNPELMDVATEADRRLRLALNSIETSKAA